MSSTSTTDTQTVTITVRGEDTECTFDGMIMVNGVCVAAVICTEPMYLDEATNTCLDTPVCDTGSEWIAATNACEVPFTGEYFTITSSATVFQHEQIMRVGDRVKLEESANAAGEWNWIHDFSTAPPACLVMRESQEVSPEYRYIELEAVDAPCTYTMIRMSSTSTDVTQTVTITVTEETPECPAGMTMMNDVCTVVPAECNDQEFYDQLTNTC